MSGGQQHFTPPVVEGTLSHLYPVTDRLQLITTCCAPLATCFLFSALALRLLLLSGFTGFCRLFFADRAGALE